MVKIVSDSTCDLSKDLQKKYDITIIPLHVLMGDDERRDGVDVTPEEMYVWADANKTTPKTSAISIEDAMDAMKPILDEGFDIVAFSISQSMSATYNVLRMAAEELNAADRVSVVDSANLCTGIGLLAIEAAIMAADGKTKEEITAEMEHLKPLVRSSFVIDTLTYLHRGGRCSGMASLAGTVLKLHPRIEVVNGAMEVRKKYRGKIDGVIMEYTKDMEAELLKAKKDRVFITHSGHVNGADAAVREYVESLGHFDEILDATAGGVISSHCGPGTLGVLFIAGE